MIRGLSSPAPSRQIVRRQEQRRRRRLARRRARGIRHAAGPERLRQDHHAADDRRVRDSDQRRHRARWTRSRSQQALRAQYRHGVPELCPVPAHDGGEERGVSAQDAAVSKARYRSARAAHARARGLAPVRRQISARIIGRPAAARRARARSRVQSGRASARRAAGRARQEFARADASRDQAHPPRNRHHHDLRHARPDRGDDDVRSHRRVLQRQDRTSRLPARRL